MANYYCKNCGREYSSIQSLTNSPCGSHPNGTNKGKHQLYEGSEKSEYDCKYCGRPYKHIKDLTNGPCVNHPDGTNNGKHSPAL